MASFLQKLEHAFNCIKRWEDAAYQTMDEVHHNKVLCYIVKQALLFDQGFVGTMNISVIFRNMRV